MSFAPQYRALFRHVNAKNGPKPSFFIILIWKCASRHNGVHFFDNSTSKSGPNMICFISFDLDMCFAPQRRALFQHLNFKKWSEREICLSFFAAKCASCSSGVQLFISHLARFLRNRRFSKPTFYPREPQIIGKNTMNCDFPTFSHTCSFFLL